MRSQTDSREFDVRNPLNRASVAQELESVLHSSSFRSSRRCHDFLKYVVEQTLDGSSESIKERSIAMAVFGRPGDYEPAADSIVRVKASEVRKKLAEYYGAHASPRVRIELQPGNYVPSFVPVTPASRRRAPLLPVAGVAAAAILGLLLWLLLGHHRTLVDEVWEPLMVKDRQVLLTLPSPTIQLVAQGRTVTMEQYFVGEGAAYGAALFAGLMGARHQAFQVKVGREASFVDLRRQPAILLGAYSSPLTLDLTKGLRFHFRPVFGDLTGTAILDSKDPSRSWAEPESGRPSSDIRESYSMAVRLIDSGSGQPLIIAAGITARGTHTATEFLTSENALASFTRHAGRAWIGKNFQVVLHSEVHDQVPGPPEVLAWQIW